MTKKKDLDLILFSEPLYMGIDGVHIYGGIFSRSDSEKYKVPYMERVQLFVEYLAGVSEWVKSGNDVSMDGYYFVEKGKHYNMAGKFARDFSAKSYDKIPLKYTIIENFKTDYVIYTYGDMIISLKTYNRLMREYGKDCEFRKTWISSDI